MLREAVEPETFADPAQETSQATGTTPQSQNPAPPAGESAASSAPATSASSTPFAKTSSPQPAVFAVLLASPQQARAKQQVPAKPAGSASRAPDLRQNPSQTPSKTSEPHPYLPSQSTSAASATPALFTQPIVTPAPISVVQQPTPQRPIPQPIAISSVHTDEPQASQSQLKHDAEQGIAAQPLANCITRAAEAHPPQPAHDAEQGIAHHVPALSAAEPEPEPAPATKPPAANGTPEQNAPPAPERAHAIPATAQYASPHTSPAPWIAPSSASAERPAKSPAPASAQSRTPFPAGQVTVSPHSSAATPADPLQRTLAPAQAQPQPSQHIAPVASVTIPPAIPAHTSATNSANAAGPAPHDPFTVLDAEPTAPPATWIHAGSTRAEAGYLDPSLGWVAVRADASGATLHASIVPSSPEAAQVLGTHLAGLNTYLADHHGATAQLTISAPESGESFAGHSGFDPSGQQSSQHQSQRDGQTSAAPAHPSTSPRAEDAAPAPLFAGGATAAAPVRSGGHISVIA
jgi:hypothetical protein